MTDLVRTIREALEFHREHAGDPSVTWHDETVTQWLSQAADELEFYHSLTVSREEGVTAIDGGKTAEKLHILWEASKELERLKEEMK